MKKHDLPASRFEEKEVDRLIADYGRKPAEKTKEDTMAFLKNQKERFITLEKKQESERHH